MEAVGSIDGIVILVGIAAAVVGFLVDDVASRLICVGIVVLSTILAVGSLRLKREQLAKGFHVPQAQSPSQEEGIEMKKLVFDDFQPDARPRYISETVEEVTTALVSSEANAPHSGRVLSIEQPQAPRPKAGQLQRQKAATREFQISDFFDSDEITHRHQPGSGQPELRTEFDFLLNKALGVIKEVTFAHTVAFFWANREKQQLVCESKTSESESFLPDRRLRMGLDLVSQVARTGKPELVSRVNPLSEEELIAYYTNVEFIKSFVAVPVFFPGAPADGRPYEPVGVIAVDSQVEDSYGPETIALLAQFSKLISALIKSSTDKYDLMLDVELLNSIRRLQKAIRNDFTVHTIASSLADEMAKLLNWNYLSIVLFDDQKNSWTVKKVVNRSHEPYISPGEPVELNGSIVGGTIKLNAHQIVEEFTAESLPRFNPGEKAERRGSFLSVPISSLNKCYGALCVESPDSSNFSRKDVEIAYRLTENAASALEILHMNEVIHQYVIVDELTGVYSKKFFLQKVEEELQRSDDFGLDASLLVIAVDNAREFETRYRREGFETALLNVAKILRASVRRYDLVGRFDHHRFGVLLVNTTGNDAYIWAERIRKAVASHVMQVDDKSFSVTISVGVSGAAEGTKAQTLVENALMVLDRGLEDGGNTVRMF